MNTKLLASLEDVLEKWVDEHSQEDGWINGYFPEKGTELMAKAVSVVLDSFDSEYQYFTDNVDHS